MSTTDRLRADYLATGDVVQRCRSSMRARLRWRRRIEIALELLAGVALAVVVWGFLI